MISQATISLDCYRKAVYDSIDGRSFQRTKRRRRAGRGTGRRTGTPGRLSGTPRRWIRTASRTGPRRTTMTNGILRFKTNSPVEVALRWDDGKRVEGRYGEQVMYSLEGDRVMYVPPVVAKQIHELGIRAREIFEICKAELREENKRWI